MVDDRDTSGRIRCIEFGWSRGQAAARNAALAKAGGLSFVSRSKRHVRSLRLLETPEGLSYTSSS